MDWRERQSDTLNAEQIRAFVREHVFRNPKSDEAYVSAGFRVKFGRAPASSEGAILKEAYADEDVERTARLAAERAAEDAKKPHGFYRFLGWSWQVKALLGSVVMVVVMLRVLGTEQTGQILFYIVGVSQGAGLVPLVGAGWLIGHVIIRALQIVTRYPGRAPIAAVVAHVAATLKTLESDVHQFWADAGVLAQGVLPSLGL